MHAVREAGLRVPEDVSVIGIDDHEMAEFFELTTVAQPVHEQGQLAATLLLEALDDDLDGPAHPRTITVPTRLVVRRTTAPPPGTQTGLTGLGCDVDAWAPGALKYRCVRVHNRRS